MTEKLKQRYIDPWVKDAFQQAGVGNFISKQDLADFSQIYRSYEGRSAFEEKTGVPINSIEDMKHMFELAAEGELNLREVLNDPSFKKYVERQTPLSFD
jgi:hypothetical protein